MGTWMKSICLNEIAGTIYIAIILYMNMTTIQIQCTEGEPEAWLYHGWKYTCFKCSYVLLVSLILIMHMYLSINTVQTSHILNSVWMQWRSLLHTNWLHMSKYMVITQTCGNLLLVYTQQSWRTTLDFQCWDYIYYKIT